MAGSVLTGRDRVTRHILVKKDTILGDENTYTFAAHHWHEYPDKSLEIIDDLGDVVASFNSHRWTQVYFEDVLVDIREGKS